MTPEQRSAAQRHYRLLIEEGIKPEEAMRLTGEWANQQGWGGVPQAPQPPTAPGSNPTPTARPPAAPVPTPRPAGPMDPQPMARSGIPTPTPSPQQGNIMTAFAGGAPSFPATGPVPNQRPGIMSGFAPPVPSQRPYRPEPRGNPFPSVPVTPPVVDQTMTASTTPSVPARTPQQAATAPQTEEMSPVQQRRADLRTFERGEKLRPGAQFGNQRLAEALMRRKMIGQR